MPEPTRPAPVCPICTVIVMAFACRVVNVEVYGCKYCGATLTVPVKTDGP